MKLLYFASPQILGIQVNELLNDEYKGGKLVMMFAWFIFSRIFCLVIGFDAYLVKFRAAERYIDVPDFTLKNIAGAFSLLNQILGVVPLAWVIKDRLFQYVFTGEDGIMSHSEKIRKDTWNALIAERIWNTNKYFYQKVVLLLSFNDGDFQKLTLNCMESAEEEEKRERKEGKLPDA